MNRYQTKLPRATLGVAAFALTALTLGLFVGAPATLAPGSSADVTLASAARNAAPTEVAITPARIEVVGVREPVVASAAQPVIVAAKSRRGG